MLTVASFFSFYDFARNIVDGMPLQVENLVPTGLHDHGWQPSAEVTQQIIEADAFLHVGPGFQPWADRAIQTLKDDNADTHLINAREGVDLLPLAETLDPERAKTSVDNIAEGMAEIAPDHESALMDNAETYKADVLEQVRQDFQAMFEESDRDVVQLTAHNAFQYWADAYGIEMRPLVTNLAASGNVAPEDITEA